MENYTEEQKRSAKDILYRLGPPLREAQRVPVQLSKRDRLTLVDFLTHAAFLAGEVPMHSLLWAAHSIQMQVADEVSVSARDVAELVQALKYIASGGEEQIVREDS